MIVVHKDLKHSLQTLEPVTFPRFLTRSDRSGLWNYFQTVLYHCADIPVPKNICTAKYGLIVPRPCYQFLETLEYFEKMTHSNISHSLRTAFIREEVQKLRTNLKFLENSGDLQQVRVLKKNIEDT